MPYLFMRDDKNLYIVCVKKGNYSMVTLSPARYESIQAYKTMVVVDSGLEGEFDLLVLTHKSDQTSRLMMLRLDKNFIEALRERIM